MGLDQISFSHFPPESVMGETFELWFKKETQSEMIDGLVLQVSINKQQLILYKIKNNKSEILFALT